MAALTPRELQQSMLSPLQTNVKPEKENFDVEGMGNYELLNQKISRLEAELEKTKELNKTNLINTLERINKKLSEVDGSRELQDLKNFIGYYSFKGEQTTLWEKFNTLKQGQGNISAEIDKLKKENISKALNYESNRDFSQDIKRLENNIRIISETTNTNKKNWEDSLEEANNNIARLTRTLNEKEAKINRLEKWRAELETKLKYAPTGGGAEDAAARMSALEERFSALSNEIKRLSSRVEEFEKSGKGLSPEWTAESDGVISAFNGWAGSLSGRLPAAFAYLSGDFKIRVSQPLTTTPEESKWITNREGAKKYLLPNPRLFGPMTNIIELYAMDQNLLKEKGKNKIKIITPCEMSPSGWIEFAGKLQIIP